MLDALKTLFENNVISEEIKADIEKAWEAKLTEARSQVTYQLREEFAQKYEHDKAVMVEAVDHMLRDKLTEEIAQFVEDRQQLAEERARIAVKAKENEALMKEFITRQLTSEVKELHEDQVQMASKFHTLEKFVIEALAQEIAEFYTDKKDLAETKVRLVREGKATLEKLKEQFIKRAAKLVESAVDNTLTHEITQLREDIEAARRHEFGRKLFEAFASEYQTSYLNEKTEAAKLLNVIDKKDREVAEAKRAVAKAQQILESKEAQIKVLAESKVRQEIMHELLSPLATDKKAIMSELLESVHTSKLRTNFEKYLPAVVAGESTRKKQVLAESKEVTGNKPTHSASSSEDHNIYDIRRLAGIKH
jgi:hypothetical protein